MTVVTLERWFPPSRRDVPTPLPWTAARMEASADTDPLVFTSRRVVDFAGTPEGLDDDPRYPMPRTLTAEDSLPSDVWWRVVFIDADGDESLPSLPIRVVPWRPSLQDVADKCPEHTRIPIDAGGGVSRTFDEQTDPTASAVQGLITSAVDEVEARVGTRITATEETLARVTAAWHAAAAVQDAVRKEGVDDADSSRGWAWASYIACLGDLKDIARRRPVRLR